MSNVGQLGASTLAAPLSWWAFMAVLGVVIIGIWWLARKQGW